MNALYGHIDAILPPLLVALAVYALVRRYRAEKAGCAQCPVAQARPQTAIETHKHPLVQLGRR